MRASIVSFALILGLVGCNQPSEELKQALQRIEVLEEKLDAAYRPGWGESMRGSTQVHHSNLWFAGAAENWELAEHMIEELEEGFEKLEKWYPDDDRTKALPMIHPPLNTLADAIEKKDQEAFVKGYIMLTTTCNACHAATGNEIYVIQTPDKPGFTNQSFEPQKK